MVLVRLLNAKQSFAVRMDVSNILGSLRAGIVPKLFRGVLK
jgi:hypothetical protein